MAGWIALQKGIETHWLWTSKEPFDMRSAWIDLLIQANFIDFKTEHRKKLVERKRGEVNTSYRYLAERWRWDRRKVKRFLSLLESDGMVSVDSTTDGTTITIENYSKWQDISTTQSTTHSTTDSTTHSTTHSTNDNNNNNINNINKKRGTFVPPTLEEVEAYIFENGYSVDAGQFIDFYSSKGWKVGKNPMKDWKASVRTWERRNKDKPQGSTSTNPFMEMLQNGDY